MNKRFAFFSFMWYNILTSVFENERGKIMAYVALYRSYRPSSFKEVIGQKHVVQTLKIKLHMHISLVDLGGLVKPR